MALGTIAASSPVLSRSTDLELQHRGHEMAKIAASIKEALVVSRLVKPDLLGIELNTLAGNFACKFFYVCIGIAVF